MKMYSKSELAEKVKKTFKKYPKTKTVFCTTDGQFFLDENRAELHADSKRLNVYSFENNLEKGIKKDQKTKKQAK